MAVIPITRALEHLRTRPRCLLCDRVLTRQEQERFTSFCEADVPGLLIRFEHRDHEVMRSG